MNQQVDSYFALSANSRLFTSSVSPYDFYIKIGESHYVRVFNVGAEIENSRIQGYRQKGINQFYISRTDAEGYLKSLISLLDHSTSQKISESLPIATEALEISLLNFFDNPVINVSDINRITIVCDYLAEAIEKETSVLNVLETAFNNSAYGVKHSIDVALVCLGIYTNLKADLKIQLSASEVVQAGLLHDIAIASLLPEPYDHATSRMILAKGWLLAHSVMAAHALEQAPSINKKVQLAIEQHHEFLDGSGGPYAIESDQISLLGKVLALAEDFQVRVEAQQGAAFEKRKKAFNEIEATSQRFGIDEVTALKNFLNVIQS